MSTWKARLGALLLGGALIAPAQVRAENFDFGKFVGQQLKAKSMQQFGVEIPLAQSSTGPYTALDNVRAIEAAAGLVVTQVTNATHEDNDLMALWPNDTNPTHLIVAIESGTTAPGVQMVNLATGAVSTIVTGLNVSDPLRLTPWGTIIVAEEAGSLGGFDEILDPLSLIGAVMKVTGFKVK